MYCHYGYLLCECALVIRSGYADVVNYLLRTGHVSASMKDLDNKGLLFTAVMHNQPKVLKYLLSHVSRILFLLLHYFVVR